MVIMNLILLLESDFVDTTAGIARITGRRMEHAISVCNAGVATTLRVGLANGNIGKATVLSLSGDSLTMGVVLDEIPPKPLPLTLIIAMPRPKSFIKCIEVATIMGVKQMYFIHSYRVEKHYWGSQKISENSIEEHIHLGLEQARDTMMPAIEFRRRFKPFFEDEIPEIIKGTTALVAHPYAAQPCPYNVQCPVTLAIGPEGGFIPYEIDMMKNRGFEAISLGERILRVEHAIPALIGRLL